MPGPRHSVVVLEPDLGNRNKARTRGCCYSARRAGQTLGIGAKAPMHGWLSLGTSCWSPALELGTKAPMQRSLRLKPSC